MSRALAVFVVLASSAASAQVAPPSSGGNTDEPGEEPREKSPKAGLVPAPIPEVAKPIVAFDVRGDSKVKPQTMGYLARVSLGDRVSSKDVPKIEQALVSSELFEKVAVALEDREGGVAVVATVKDKLSWIIAPALFVLPGNRAVGLGYAENDFRGLDRKILLYGQLGTRNSLFFGTFLDPAYHGTKLTWRTDIYIYHRMLDEYANPHGDATNFDIARTTTQTYLGAGALIGWNFKWWLVADVRLRGAYVYFREPVDDNGDPLPLPQQDGWDFTMQGHLTLDARGHYFGVTWGPYVQLTLERSVPGIDSYGYAQGLLRAYYSWRFWQTHQLEVRTGAQLGYHLPFHEELTIGGVTDLRGYSGDQFRGDTRGMFRVEYSLPFAQWRSLSFRAIGFWDSAYVGFNFRRSDRDYLPEQRRGGYFRNDVGAGLRIYIKSVVIPLLGLDLGYGIEGHSPEVNFEVGLTDF